MHYTASHQTIDHIVQLIAEVQPVWEPGLVRVVLYGHTAQVHGNDLAIAALRFAASDDALRIGPKGIGWRGPHWDGLNSKPIEAEDLRWCGVCGKRGEPRCRLERFGDDDHEFEPTTRNPRTGR